MNFSYAFSMNLFPVYSGLGTKTNRNMIDVTIISSGYATVLYCWMGIVGIMEFGRNVGNDSNLINNVSSEYTVSKGVHWESFVLRFIFLIIYILHLPPCFFPGKEALLIIIDELKRRSISSALDERVKMLNEEGDKREDSAVDLITRGSSVKRLSLQSKLRGFRKSRASTLGGEVLDSAGRSTNMRGSTVAKASEKVSYIRET